MLPGKTEVRFVELTAQKFDLLTQSKELRLCVRTKYALAWRFMFHSHKFDMKHLYFQ